MVLLLRGVVLLGLVLLVLAGGAAPVSAAPSWGWPLAGTPPVARPFAPGPTPYSPGHRGADLSARPGAAVSSAGAGVVAYAGRLAGRGVVVVVHGALRTTYEPVEASVSVGEVVLRGQRIGSLAAGHRGCPVEACLHWGLRRGLDYLDPLRLVGAGPVRLLPREAGLGSWPLGSGAGTAAPADAPGAAVDDPTVAAVPGAGGLPAAPAPASGSAGVVPVTLAPPAVPAPAPGRPPVEAVVPAAAAVLLWRRRAALARGVARP